MPDISTVTIKKNGQEATYNVKDAKARTDLDDKVSKEQGKGLSTNDYTTEEKNKLNGIENQANKTVVDSELSDSSTNPVQNKVVKQAINDMKITVDSELSEKADVIVSSASGSIAHFEDGAEANAVSVIAHIEPVQDLHGYDSPWPAGGGKNLIPYPYTETTRTVNGITFIDNGDGSITVNGTATGNAIFQIKDRSSGNTPRLVPGEVYKLTGCPTGGSSSTYKLDILKYGSVTYAVDYGGSNRTFTYTEDTADDVIGQIRIVVYSGATVSNLVFKPMLTLASETDDTWEPYSNICPISGFTGMDVVRTGVNIWDEEWEPGAYNTRDGQKQTSSAGRIRSANYIPVKAGKQYTVIGNVDGILLYGIDKEYLGYTTNFQSLTAPNNAYFATFYSKTNYGSIYNNDISINYPSTDTAYHAYQGETYPIAFPSEAGTAYGGYVDVTQGKLVVDRAMVVLRKNFSNWTKSSNYPGGFFVTLESITNYYGIPVFKRHTPFICSHAKTAYTLREYARGTCFCDTSCNIRIMDSDTTVTEWGNYLEEQFENNTPVQCCLEFATPITYDLTPQQIALLLGVNNVWNDCNGNTDVEYKADTKLYIEQLTKPTEDDMTANANIASGKFFMIGNRLFLSTAAIAEGATIEPGTNCTEISLADALNTVNS